MPLLYAPPGGRKWQGSNPDAPRIALFVASMLLRLGSVSWR